MTYSSRLKLSTDNFSPDTDLIEVFSKKAGVVGVINPRQIAPPSGTAGAIQFSDGTYFSSDVANLIWNNTTKSLGVGTNTPLATVHIKGSGSTSATNSLHIQNSAGTTQLYMRDDGVLVFAYQIQGPLLRASSNLACSTFQTQNYAGLWMSVDDSVNVGNVTIGNGTTTLGARVGIKGSGSTSATTSLLVQNSSGGNLLQVKDNGLLTSNVDNEGGAFSIDVDTNAQTTLKLKPFGNNFNAAYQATIYNNYGNLVIKSAAYGNVTTELFGNGQYKITDNFAYNYLTVYGANVGGKSVFGRPVEIKGTGSTSATTSLLVQNSAGTTALKITDDSSLNFATNMKWTWTGGASSKNMFMNDSASGWGGFIFNSSLTYSGNTNELLVIATTKNAFKLPLAIGVALNPNDNLPLMSDSAVLQADSTTQGLLKPRMTTTQKNAISSPAAGLEVFDTTLGRPCFYSGSAWVTL